MADRPGEGRAVYAALASDILIAVCSYLPPPERVRFCLTCREFAAVLEERSPELYADFGPRQLGRHGQGPALALRWRRRGVSQQELCAGFAGACAGRHESLARKLGARLGAGAPTAAVDEALLSLCAGGELYELAKWVLGSCPARPSRPGICAAFVAACDRGYLGFAQLAYRAYWAAAQADDAQAAQDLLLLGLEVAAESPRGAHVVAWVAGRLRVLAELAGAA